MVGVIQRMQMAGLQCFVGPALTTTAVSTQRLGAVQQDRGWSSKLLQQVGEGGASAGGRAGGRMGGRGCRDRGWRSKLLQQVKDGCEGEKEGGRGRSQFMEVGCR